MKTDIFFPTICYSSCCRNERKAAMEKSIERHLNKHGYKVEGFSSSQDESRGVSFKCYGKWFEESILGLDSEEYRRAFWHEAHTTGHTIGPVPHTLKTLLHNLHVSRGSETCGILLAIAFAQGGVYPFWLITRLISRGITRMRRSTYYERERTRRHRLADERRAIRIRRTANPCPTVTEIREAWFRVRATTKRGRKQIENHVLTILHLGALLEDLECYVDNHAYVTRGVPGIKGRAPGIKGFLSNNAPDLHENYKSIMRCKALAKKFRQACGCLDPIPVNSLLPIHDMMCPEPKDRQESSALPITLSQDSRDFASGPSALIQSGLRTVDGIAFPVFPQLENLDSLRIWMNTHGNTDYLRTRCRPEWSVGVYTEKHLFRPEALTQAAHILKFGNGTRIALEAAIALRIDPACAKTDLDPNNLESPKRPRVSSLGRHLVRTSNRVCNWLMRHGRSIQTENMKTPA